MESHIAKIVAITPVTHDVKSFRVEKPRGYQFVPGQATEVSIRKAGWEEEKRPFTFTSLNENPWLEFTIKRYEDHKGVTNELHKLKEGDEIIIRDVWGAIEYKGAGYFIAGGAGITPFIAILRQLHKENRLSDNVLFFSNKTAADIIYENEFKKMLANNAHFILTREGKEGYEKGMINKEFIQSHVSDFNRHFYICGPDRMISDISAMLKEEGANPDSVVFEK